MDKKSFYQKHKIKTKLDEERVRKKIIGEEMEKLDAMGQENEHAAAHWVKEEAKKNEKDDLEKRAKEMQILDEQKKNRTIYRQRLLSYFHDAVAEIQFPVTYQWGVWFDGKGICIAIRDRLGGFHKRAFSVSFDPKYDLYAIYSFCVWAEDVLDTVEQSNKKIWTPTKYKN